MPQRQRCQPTRLRRIRCREQHTSHNCLQAPAASRDYWGRINQTRGSRRANCRTGIVHPRRVRNLTAVADVRGLRRHLARAESRSYCCTDLIAYTLTACVMCGVLTRPSAMPADRSYASLTGASVSRAAGLRGLIRSTRLASVASLRIKKIHTWAAACVVWCSSSSAPFIKNEQHACSYNHVSVAAPTNGLAMITVCSSP